MSVSDAQDERTSGAILLENEFFRLGVSVRDTVARIVEAASDPLLKGDQDEIARARLTLTNPRARLASEVGWLPGVAPARARQMANSLVKSRVVPILDEGLPPMARANLFFSQLALADTGQVEPISALRRGIQAIAEIDPEAVLSDINQDREIAGLPQVRKRDALDEALARQVRLYNSALRGFLDRLDTVRLISTLTEITAQVTENGQRPAADALELLVDTYELEAQAYFEGEADVIRTLGQAIFENASKGEAHISPAVERLLRLLGEWDLVTKPIQLIRQGRGQVHRATRDLAQHVRGIAVDLANDFNYFALSSNITAGLASAFPALSEFHDVLSEDAQALNNLNEQLTRKRDEEAALNYSATVGLSKSTLSISAHEVSWGGRTFKIEDIDRIRYGGTRHSVNGIPTGTTYVIAFGAGFQRCEISTHSKEVFANFTDRLWRTCGLRIAIGMLQQLKGGATLQIGGVSFTDTHVQLKKSQFFKSEQRLFSWSEVLVMSQSGNFVIAAKADRGFTALASYNNDDNAHVLANMINFAFDKGKIPLSTVLD